MQPRRRRGAPKSRQISNGGPVQAPPPPVAGRGAEALGQGRDAPAPSHPDDRRPEPFQWEYERDNPHAMEALGELRRLTERMGRADPLAALGIHVEAGAGELGRLLFDSRSEVNALVLAFLDFAARGAARDAAAGGHHPGGTNSGSR